MPPYTISLQTDPIPCPELRLDSANGAEVFFAGKVRNLESEAEIEGIAYSSYEKMARKSLTDIAESAGRRFGSHTAVIRHRTGFVKAGDVSILISVSTKHSKPAFEICQYLLGEIKRSTPIWKQPIFSKPATIK